MANKTIAETDDFGFSFEDEQEVTDTSEIDNLIAKVDNLETEVTRIRGVNREILKRVTVLMNNLKKNPDKAMIKWPNRVEAIDKFLAELNELHNPKKEEN